MRYLHVLAAFAAMPWALQPDYLAAAVQILSTRATGAFTPDTEAKLTQKREAEVARQEGAIAVLPVFGVMAQRMSGMDEMCSGGTSLDRVMGSFRASRDDDRVKAIVMHLDTPGGSTYGVEEAHAEIIAARGIKPIIAQIDSLGASAGYWLATAADEIVVTPGGRGGSIGVYSVHEDLSVALEKAGVKHTVVVEGENKAIVNPFGPLSAAGRAQMETLVKEAAKSFRDNVAQGRNVSSKAVVDKFGDGLVFGAKALVERGMADRIGTMQDTLGRLGMPSKKQAAAAQTRATFAAGEIPTIRAVEAALGDLGMSNAQAERFVTAGYAGITAGDPPAPAAFDDQAKSHFAALRAQLARI